MVLSRENSMKNYDAIINQMNFDWCRALKIVTENYFTKLMIVALQQTNVEDLLKVCEKTGRFKMYNISFEDSPAFAGIWPSGNYRGNYIFHDEIDGEIFNLTYWSRLIKK